MIGIIIPPGEIKKLAQKTAQHVAANGYQFQKMILQRQLNNTQFAFLQKDNPYRAYYDHMVADISKKLIQEAQAQQINEVKEQQIEEVKESHVMPQHVEVKIQEPINQQTEFLQRVFEEVKEPEPDRFTTQLPQKITQAEITMIEHTAQYVAKMGRDFLAALSERQKSNPQFQFLKSSSNNYTFFVKTYEAYHHLLNLSSSDIAALETIRDNRQAILSKCQGIFQYHQLKQKQTKNKKNPGSDQKAQTLIDWNDYQLVQTIVFQSTSKGNKNLPSSLKSQQLNPFATRQPQQKIISLAKKKQILQQCHICRNNILASQMTKHLKSCLGDKKRISTVSNMNQGEEVDMRRNLENFGNKRPDIFGGDGKNINRKEQQIQQNDKIIWDGQAPNMTRTTGSIAMVNNQQRKLKQTKPN